MINYTSSKKFLWAHRLAYLLFQKYRFLGSRKLSRQISKIILPSHKEAAIIPTIYNFSITLPPEKNFEIQELYYLGFYEAGTLKVINTFIQPNSIFVDVGASVGLMSLFVANIAKQKLWNTSILIFEPMQEMCNYIKTSIKYNHFDSSSIQIFPYALGDQDTQLPIYTHHKCPSLIANQDEKPDRWIEVKTLDSIIQKNQIDVSKISMIKIDVEGFEYQVLIGAKEILKHPYAPPLCIEYMENYKNIHVFEYIQNINQYELYQLKYGKAIESHLEKRTITSLHPNDNVFCLLPHHINQYRLK